MAVDPDGELIAAGSNDQTLRLWDARSGELVREVELPGPREVEQARPRLLGTVAFDRSGTRIAVGSSDGTLEVIDAKNGERIGTVMQHPGAVSSVAFGHDGRWIATGDSTGTVRVWDLVKGTVRPVPADANARGPVAKSVAFSRTADVVAAANGSGVRLLDALSGDTLRSWDSRMGCQGERLAYPVTSVAFNSAGDRLVVGGMAAPSTFWTGTPCNPWRHSGHIQA